MVDLSDPKGPVKEGIDNTIFIVPGIIMAILISFFVYKLVVSLKEKERLREEKKKTKLARREKEKAGKQKKK